MVKYRKIQSEVDAIKWQGNLEDLECLKPYACLKDPLLMADKRLKIFNMNNTFTIEIGSYIGKTGLILEGYDSNYIEKEFIQVANNLLEEKDCKSPYAPAKKASLVDFQSDDSKLPGLQNSQIHLQLKGQIFEENDIIFVENLPYKLIAISKALNIIFTEPGRGVYTQTFSLHTNNLAEFFPREYLLEGVQFTCDNNKLLGHETTS